MNFYYYWFFFLYNIYSILSKDREFYIFAFGMFNGVFLGLPVISLLILLSSILDKWGVYSPFHNLFFWFLIPTIYLCINYFLFMHKGKHRRLFSKYLSVRSTPKDVLCFFLSLIALSSSFLAISFNK